MTTIRADIHAGPSKFDLMLALFDRAGSRPRSVQFTAGPGHSLVDVVITGVSMEDGSGESWLFEGYERPPRDRGTTTPLCGSYRTNTRAGWLSYKE